MSWKQSEETNPPTDFCDPELERLMRDMPPTRPTARLDQRVRLALAAHRPAGWFAVGALSATAAAAAVIAFSLPLLRREAPSHVLMPGLPRRLRCRAIVSRNADEEMNRG